MSEIEILAFDLLDQKELQLADNLAFLLGDDKWDAGPLVKEILPVYWEKVGDRLRNPHPGTIYRPLNYIVAWSSHGDFGNSTRAYLDVISSHIEGCLQNLLHVPVEHRTMPRAFGPAVVTLKNNGVLSGELANQLFMFNSTINIPAKHFGAYEPTRWLDERTFSVIETTHAIVLMRKLSIQLFTLLNNNGVPLPYGWPEFKEEWLTWYQEYKPQSGTDII
ncbi:hypothetical protein ACFLXC_06080 [Chloroflexota bacterium]